MDLAAGVKMKDYRWLAKEAAKEFWFDAREAMKEYRWAKILLLAIIILGVLDVGITLNSHLLIPRAEKVNVWEIFDDGQKTPDDFLDAWLAAFDKPDQGFVLETELEKTLGKNQKIIVNFQAASYIDEERKLHPDRACWYCYKFNNKGQATIWIKADALYDLTGRILEIKPGRSVYVILKTGLPPKDVYAESRIDVLKRVELFGLPIGYQLIGSVYSEFVVPKAR